jgi:hypothetical protein
LVTVIEAGLKSVFNPPSNEVRFSVLETKGIVLSAHVSRTGELTGTKSARIPVSAVNSNATKE